MGDRWVSPPTYAPGPQSGKEYVLDARIEGVDQWGNPIRLDADWSPTDPKMVEIVPGEEQAVQIVIKRAGKSAVKVASEGVVKELLIEATDTEHGLKVEVAQDENG